ncbi:MAG: carbamoyltransferase HypF, partial [Pirellulaceae bacterium]|nr:carbamoyltransferase HypF [Pirellulaceae bacterium]
MSIIRRSIQVTGIVQGVGFRPYVWRLAQELKCTGLVCNNARGVWLEIQGPSARVADFQRRLSGEAPIGARIVQLQVHDCQVHLNETGFTIVDSRTSELTGAAIAPDSAICDDCLAELRDPSDRRCGYPFINCTNCGPRFTIIQALPYDRSRTTLSGMTLCDACQAEYNSPADRRFHAEPNACPACGPRIWYVESRAAQASAHLINTRSLPATAHATRQVLALEAPPFHLSHEAARTVAVIREVQTRISAGAIVAIKGIGGFHLACDAMNVTSIRSLRDRKHRPNKPLAVMVADLASCQRFACVGEQEAQWLVSRQRPIVLLQKKIDTQWLEALAPNNPLIGVMLAYAPLHHLLIEQNSVWVMTSGNLSDEPIAIDNAEALSRLSSMADGFLFHNRPIATVCDDSVVRFTETGELPIRLGRGFAPLTIGLTPEPASSDCVSPRDHAIPTILAVGGEIKSS